MEDSPEQQGVFQTRSAASNPPIENVSQWFDRNKVTLDRGSAGAFTPEVGPLTVGQYFDDNSRYDKYINNIDEVIAGEKSINNIRGEIQPWYAQIGAGVAKGAVLAATTLLDGTIGTLIGAANALVDRKWSSFWNNPFGRAMQSISEWSEEAIPNYYTKQEETEPWYLNIISSNFLGDKFLKNLGFTVGAFMSGNIYSAALNSIKAPTLVKSFTGSMMSAINEGKIEALNNSKDWAELQKVQLDDKYQADRDNIIRQYAGSEMLQPLLYQLELTYNQSLAKISEDALKMGNVDFLLNLPILTASNAIQFGKMYAGGFKTARRVGKVKLKDGKYVAPFSKLGGIARGVKTAASEGTEEITQKIASEIPGLKYGSEITSFYNASINPDAEDETISWLKASGQGILDVVGDVNSWEEFTVGAMTGMLGMPRFRSVRNKVGGIQSPIYIDGGMRGELKEYKEKRERTNTVVDYLNERVQSPEFKKYYQGMIRHNKYQGDMDQAALDGDKFEYKNAEQAQFISDIIMFDSANKLDDLRNLIESSYDVSPENIQSIVENTTDENGNGPYRGMTQEEIAQRVTEKKDEMLQSIDGYNRIKDQIDVMSGEILDDEQLAELVYLRSMSSNWEDRFDNVATEVKQFLSKFREGVINPQDRAAIDQIASLSNEMMFSLLKEDDNDIAKQIDKLYKQVDQSNDVQKFDILQKMEDMQKLAEATNLFNTRYNEFMQDPMSLKEAIEKSKENAQEEQEQAQTKDLRESLTTAKTMQQFRQYASNNEDTELVNKTIDQLAQEGNQLAKDYKDISNYMRNLSNNIQQVTQDEQTISDALKLVEDQLQSISKVGDFDNIQVDINPEAIYDDTISDEENSLRFSRAQDVLFQAIARTNEGERFKERFPKEDLTVEEKVDNAKGVSGDVTGDSQTTVIPSVNEGPVAIEEAPVGDITSQMVQDENNLTNRQAQSEIEYGSKQRGKRQYYSPVIPELHIEASKEGDFRPFDVVVAERENKDFSELYSYLNDNGAFSYINEGNLRVGDELGFMIDPAFNDHTIFIVDKRNNQIVGSLAENEYVLQKYEGLEGLVQRIKQEFNQTGKDKKFIATPTTRVSQIMVGRIPYGTTENNLQDIPGVSDESVFGIIKNGTMVTNKLNDDGIIKPVDISGKEGRMYLLIPNAAGKYSPAAVRVKHFNSTEYNPKDVLVNSTPFYKNIQEAAMQMATSIGQDDFKDAVHNMGLYLYMGDMHVDFSPDQYIKFVKVQRDQNGREIVDEVDGKRIRREDTRFIRLSDTGEDAPVAFTDDGNGGFMIPTKQVQAKSNADVVQEIISTLQHFNLPMQVNISMINNKPYNQMLLSSNILTSNITQAIVKSNWFTTDYFDLRGNLQQALSPASVVPAEGRKVSTPVGGLESSIPGTLITHNSTDYYVDLTTNTVRDNNNKVVSDYPQNILDLAYLQSNYGRAQNSATMINGIALLPSGKVINRNTGEYLSGSEETDFKQRLQDKNITIADSKKVIDQIAENQNRVDESRTDGQYYYILEEDGNYHEYERVHSVLGNNYIESPKQTEALKNLRSNLIKHVDNVTQFDNYLQNLQQHYGVNLQAFQGKTDARSRDTIVNVIRDKMLGTNSQRALDAGTSVDSIVRNFFTSNEVPTMPANITVDAFNNLITSLEEIKTNLQMRGEIFLTNNIVLYQKYSDGSRIAGEVDILAIGPNGKFRIYDIKTSKYSFHDFTDNSGKKVNYFTNKSKYQKISSSEYYTKQLSAYKNLFESQYHTPVDTLAILPFVLNYNDKNEVVKAVREKGILINYDSGVNVPLAGAVSKVQEDNMTSSPLFNSALETLNPINDVLPEYNIEGSKVGYFIMDGRLHKGYIAPIGKVGEVDVHMTMVPEITKGFGNSQPRVAIRDYYAVFPNGNTVKIISDPTNTYTNQTAGDKIKEVLGGNIQKVMDISQQKTIMYDPQSKPVEIQNPVTPATINQSNNSGAQATIAREQAVAKKQQKYTRPLKLREVKGVEPLWDRQKELEWLNRVLPQMSENNLVQIQKGLIKVAKTSALAWGQFDNGIITLSDIAAEGTVYHEAFHAVFNLLTDVNEREELLSEAKKKYGDLSNDELEEHMAEGFREYIMTRDTQNLASKIINFFKQLLAKVLNWRSLRPSLMEYYRNINEGYYSNSDYKVSPLYSREKSIIDFNNLESDTRAALESKGWTVEQWTSVSQEEREQALRCL